MKKRKNILQDQPNVSKLTFHGGAGEVTGSNFLFEVNGLKILIDCGLFQGCDLCDDKTRNPFPYDPASVEYLFVTHAHLDHMGRIPKLVKDGFRGIIYSTPPTKDLSEIALFGSLDILREEAKAAHKPVLYEEDDIKKTMSLWKTVPYHEEILLGNEPARRPARRSLGAGGSFSGGGLSVTLKDAGHILGSAMVEFNRRGKKVVFTGDLGNSPTPLLSDTESIEGTDYLLMESVYGDRNHESKDLRRALLEDIVEQTASQAGTLLIPAFSIERTQEILFEIERMMEAHQVPPMPVFVDSPLAIRAIEIYKRYEDYFNKEVRYIISSGNELFSFKQLRLIKTNQESQKIHAMPNPKIIIAGSGMSAGGRIIYHEKRYLSDPRTTLLIVSYQAPGSLGRNLLEGMKKVSILGEEVAVRARIAEIRGYSSHKDSDALLKFVEKGVDSLQKVFVVMGEMRSSTFLTQRLRDYLGVNAFAPQEGDLVEIDF